MVKSGIAALVAGWPSVSELAHAESPPELKLCPPIVSDTCYIGYVTAAGKIVVLLSSADNDVLVGEEAEVDVSPPEASASKLDLTKQIGSVVMIDATGRDRIYSAKLVWVADPLLTALYMSTFLQPPSYGNSPQ